MLLGLFGMYATGKTTFLNNFKDDLIDASVHNLVVVLADIATEYWYEPTDDVWIARYVKPIYKGTQQEKLPHIDEMVGDRDMLWILESARYFAGLHETCVESAIKHRGGLRFIIPVTTPEVGKRFLMERAKKRNKHFRDDYWTKGKLEYECMYRYINAMKNIHEPVGIWYETFMVDYKRTVWAKIGNVMLEQVALPVDEWYSLKQLSPKQGNRSRHEDLPDKGNERKREDNHSETVIVRVPRR
jgi:hypothetical protein